MGDGQIGMGGGALDILHNALDNVKTLRCNVGAMFEFIASGHKPEVDGPTTDKEKNFKIELHSFISKIYENVRELDQAVGTLNPPTSGPFNLGNSGLINQEVSPEKIPLYNQLMDSYKWLDKVHEYSNVAAPRINQTPLKRTHFSASLSQKRRRVPVNTCNVPPAAVDAAIAGVANNFKDMEVIISRPLGSNAALCITLGRTLRMVVILKGWLIEWVVVRGINEDMTKEDNSVDLWTESRFKVFQKVSDNANGAMLHFYTPIFPELSVKSFMSWLHSYITLFTAPCKKCNLHLLNNLPPTWRDLRTLDPYHEECKP